MNRYEEILINPPDDFIELKSKIKNYINFYNNIKPHQSLNYNTSSGIFTSC